MALIGPCGATADQVPAVAALADDVFNVSRGWLAGMYPTVFRASNAPWLRTFWDGQRPVSLVAVWRGEIETFRRRLPVARVGSVSTLPAYRGQGLAGTLLRDALTRLQATGTALVVISGRGPLDQRAGSHIFGDLREFSVDAAALPTVASPDFECVAPQTPEPAILADMALLHERESVRYLRSAEDWRLLPPAKHYLPAQRGRGTVLVRRDGHTVAYALWGDRAEEDMLDVHEFAGDRDALPHALGWMLRHTGRARARLRAQPTDTAMLRWAETVGIMEVPTPAVGPQGAPRPGDLSLRVRHRRQRLRVPGGRIHRLPGRFPGAARARSGLGRPAAAAPGRHGCGGAALSLARPALAGTAHLGGPESGGPGR